MGLNATQEELHDSILKCLVPSPEIFFSSEHDSFNPYSIHFQMNLIPFWVANGIDLMSSSMQMLYLKWAQARVSPVWDSVMWRVVDK